jgi:uncharacterized phage infection (PIP) family protein YhgE
MNRVKQRGITLVAVAVVLLIAAVFLLGVLILGQKTQNSASNIGAQTQGSQSLDTVDQKVADLMASLKTLANDDEEDDASCGQLRQGLRDIEAAIADAILLGALKGSGTKTLMKKAVAELKDDIDEYCEDE